MIGIVEIALPLGDTTLSICLVRRRNRERRGNGFNRMRAAVLQIGISKDENKSGALSILYVQRGGISCAQADRILGDLITDSHRGYLNTVGIL